MAKLNEGISQIKKGSALETMYNRLLTGMEQASHETLPDFTGSDYVDGYVVNEEKINLEIHEYENITRKNSAYLLANTIISSLSSEEGGGSGTGGFVSINGDSMAGLLKALYGFTAGDNGIKILDVYQTSESNPQERKNIVSINGELHLPTHGLYINGCNVISYDNDIIALNGDVICSGYIRLGDLEISKDGISYQGNEFYHSGNSNKEDVSWTMKDGTVAGNLSVKGTSTFQSGITALYGVDLGFDNTSVLVISAKRLAQLTGDLNIVTGGIKFDDNYIIHVKNNNVISFSASNKILNWGDDNTKQINLQTSIYDDDGEYEMISKFGSAYFPESFKAGHNLGNILIETYKIYSASKIISMIAQSEEWFAQHIGKKYTFSFWIYAGQACQLSILQNDKAIGTVQIPIANTNIWSRKKVTFELQAPKQAEEALVLSIVPTFDTSDNAGESIFYFSSPQLEAGELVTQYQPTDTILNYTEDYGAWFNRGGIGGTIQNPLLQLNFDGEGSIGTRSNSVLIKTDGSGHFANKNIKWNKNGDVTFGKNVTMTWDNLDQSVKDELVSKSIRIVGTDTFTLLGDLTGADPVTNPADITLTLEEENLQSTSSQRQWYYLQGYDYIPFEGENGKTLTIWPFEPYWDNGNSLTVRCIVKFSDEEYSATFTIRKQYIVGYSLEITSSQGVSYKNNSCQTVLTANVYYQGKLVDPDYVAKNYIFKWTRYHLPDMENEVIDWWKEQRDNEGNIVQQEIDRSKPSITLNYGISGQDCFMCELLNGNMFPYEFPLIF